jgi:hypothetical protein
MRKIYELAMPVFVWLGPESSPEIDAGANELIRMEESLARQELSQRWAEDVKLRVVWWHGKFGNAAFPALVSILDKSYWDRMWIVQEIFFAADVRMTLRD